MNSVANDSPRSTSARVRAAQVLALIALVAALIGALGPSERVRTTYSWPPETLSAEAPSRLWYTPLLLARQRPETISAQIPCTLPPALPNADDPVTVLATARSPGPADALAVTQIQGQLVISIGEGIVGRVPPPRELASPSGCVHDLRLGYGQWSIEDGSRGRSVGGPLETMPRVNGLFSALDLRGRNGPSIDVTTAVHATRTTGRQSVAWAVAALAIAAALLLISLSGTPRAPWSVAAGLIRRAIESAHPVDAVVAVALLVWWVIAPVNFDDGWVQAREQMFASSRGFSIYYNTLAANMPLDYWIEWAHRWLAEATSAILVLRIPALFCVAAIWVVCRWVVSQLTTERGRHDSVVLWTLGCAFLAGALAWGMTLRPEPTTALLAVGVAACMLRFLVHRTAASVALGAVLVTLAVSAHPAGIISLAAVLVVAPTLLRWTRARPAIGTTIFASSTSLLVLLVTVGADLSQRRDDTQMSATFTAGWRDLWRDEIARYAFLNEEPGGTPLRRTAVALLLLAVFAFLLRQRRSRERLLGFPAIVLAVSALLLIATPSKWAWHFGALIGIGAVAVACETARLREEAARSRNWHAWPFLALAAASLVGSWAWWVRTSWSAADLRTLSWDPGFERGLSFSQLATAAPIVALVAALLFASARRGRPNRFAVSWRVASWTPMILAVPAIAFTAAILIADAARSPWTLARENIETPFGAAGCGLAGDILISKRDSARPLAAVERVRPESTPAWIPPSPASNLPRFALGPAGSGFSTSPWFEIPAGRRLGLFIAGNPSPLETLWFEWGRRRGNRIDLLQRDAFTDVVGGLAGNSPWRFYAAGELPRPFPRANIVRVLLYAEVAPSSSIAITAPVTYVNERLERRFESRASRSLVYPELLPYFPCTRLPQLRNGTVEAPQIMVLTDNGFSVVHRDLSSPFLGLLDLYEVTRVPIADTRNWPEKIFVFEIDERIPGAKVASADEWTVIS